MNQLGLFGNIDCDICGSNPGLSHRNPNLWDGFLDNDTKDHVCNGCKQEHYKRKFKNPETRGLYTEMPVVIIIN